MSDTAVGEAAVIGLPDDILGERIVAYVTLTDTADENTVVQQLSCHCETALSKFKQPSEIVAVASLPVGPTGKVRRLRVAEHLAVLKR